MPVSRRHPRDHALAFLQMERARLLLEQERERGPGGGGARQACETARRVGRAYGCLIADARGNFKGPNPHCRSFIDRGKESAVFRHARFAAASARVTVYPFYSSIT
jgi:hypothetical protein